MSQVGTPRRNDFQMSARGGRGCGGYGGEIFDFNETGSVRSMRSARSSHNLGYSPSSRPPALDLDATMEYPLETSRSIQSVDTTGSTPSPKKKNAFERNKSAGALEGYHGVRVERYVTNKRLLGLGPCQRSSVDEVVFGRDMDGSGDKDTNAEIDVLLGMFRGAAGQKNAIAEMLEDKPGQGFRGPDDDRALCLRSATRIAETGFDGCAGMKTREPRDVKRAWRRLPQQKSNVAEIVFGQDHSRHNGHEQHFMGQFEMSAGKSPRMKSSFDPDPAKRPAKSPSCRRFYQSSSLHGAEISKPEAVHHAMQKQAEAGRLTDLTDHFHGAAGKSSRFATDAAGMASRRDGGYPVYAVYR
eukprot:TRINITY_DN80102_c0_g1_i1.p1 TRINITY_DN80102_c0_g1~~TRINITY_DN80102_c0_g1_i1.p1  ORF type:complete len:356 (+),score=88.35 TRINITY_DN80102_c0_g1_i1:83-1150(+)